MRATLVTGITATHAYPVTAANTVPALAIDRSSFGDIPAVLATAYMVAMMEATSTKAIRPHLDAGEGSLGTLVNVTHLAATLLGQTVTVSAAVVAVEGRKVTFEVSAHDGLDLIGAGRHERMIVDWARFNARVGDKAAKAGAAGR